MVGRTLIQVKDASSSNKDMVTRVRGGTSEAGQNQFVTASSNFLVDVALGLVPGYSILNKFGRNSDIDTATVPESIWNGSGLYTGFNATVAETVTIASSSTDDVKTTGTGAWTIHLEGLTTGYVPATETLDLNGTTNVTSANTYLRLDRAWIMTAGTGGKNVGEITINQSTSTANVFCVMPAGANQTHIGCSTVPAGFTALLLVMKLTLNDANATVANGDLYVRELNGVFRSKMPYGIAQTGGQVTFDDGVPQISIPEKSDIDTRILVTSSNNTDVTVKLDILLIDNNYL